jgi:hypothetical protein
VVYTENKPETLKKSLINGIIENNDGILQMVVRNLLGNFITENLDGININAIIPIDKKENNNEEEESKKENEKVVEEEKNEFLEEFKIDHDNFNGAEKIDKHLEKKVKNNTELDKLINIFME